MDDENDLSDSWTHQILVIHEACGTTKCCYSWLNQHNVCKPSGTNLKNAYFFPLCFSSWYRPVHYIFFSYWSEGDSFVHTGSPSLLCLIQFSINSKKKKINKNIKLGPSIWPNFIFFPWGHFHPHRQPILKTLIKHQNLAALQSVLNMHHRSRWQLLIWSN